MVKQIIFTLLMTLGLSANFYAQNASLERFDQEGIYLRNEIWRGNAFVKNGTIHPVGFAYKNLKPEFEKTPRVMPMFLKAQRNEKISFGIGVLGLAGAAAGALLALKAVDDQGYLLNGRQYKRGINLVLFSTVLSAAINVPLQIRSRQQLNDAIWLRNRALLEP